MAPSRPWFLTLERTDRGGKGPIRKQVPIMLHGIVAGVDGSSAGQAAAHWAAREALRRNAPLLVVHVAPARPGRMVLATPTDPHPRPTGRRWTPFLATDELRSSYPELSVTADEMAGRTVPALLDAARHAELLALGSHGARTTTGFLLGSVALGAAGRATRPVVLVRPHVTAEDEHFRAADGSRSAQAPYRDVVVGLNLAWPSDRVLGFAFAAAARRSTALRVVHGWSVPGPPDGTVEDAPPTEGLFDEAGALRETLAPWQDKFPQVQVVHEIVVGPADQHLLDAASDASLMVIGRRARTSGIGSRAGATSHTVLRRIRVPVAVVPAD